jgi:hypothetical protein
VLKHAVQLGQQLQRIQIPAGADKTTGGETFALLSSGSGETIAVSASGADKTFIMAASSADKVVAAALGAEKSRQLED